MDKTELRTKRRSLEAFPLTGNPILTLCNTAYDYWYNLDQYDHQLETNDVHVTSG